MDAVAKFAVILVQDFALQALLRTKRALASAAVAVLDSAERQGRILAMTKAAEAAGIEKGMTDVQAMSRCGHVVLRTRQEAAEKEAQATLLAVAWSLSPRVEATAEGVVTLDLEGRAPDTLAPAAAAALGQLAEWGLRAQLGAARTAQLALYAAQRAEPIFLVENETSFLADLPLATADPTPEQAEILKAWGIQTLGALTRLTKHAVGRRLGEAGVKLWERAAGQVERPLKPVTPPQKFHARFEWEHEIDTLEPLLFILRRLIDRLCLELSVAGWVAGELRLTLSMADEKSYERAFALPEPTVQADVLLRMLHTHLESLHTEAAMVAVSLEIIPAPAQVKQRGLFDASLSDPHGFSESLARVSAIVGPGRVGTPRVEESHRDDAVVMEPPADALPEIAPLPRLAPVGLPLRRYRPAREAWVELGYDGRPLYLKSAAAQGEIAAARGPWRKSGEWWQPSAWQREEWDVEVRGGGLFRLVKTDAGWWVEGMYD